MSIFAHLIPQDDDEEMDLRLVQESTPWKENRPGAFTREFEYKGLYFAESYYACQFCKSPFGHRYAVHDEIWMQANLGAGIVCLKCLEVRIGRPLVREDFKNVPANFEFLHLTSPKT